VGAQERGPTQLPYSQFVLSVIPVCWAACDAFAAYGTIPSITLFRLVVCEYAVFWCFLLPSAMKIVLHLYTRLDKVIPSQATFRVRCLEVVLLYPCVGLLSIGSWMLLVVCNWSRSIVPVLTYDCALILLTAVQFNWLRMLCRFSLRGTSEV